MRVLFYIAGAILLLSSVLIATAYWLYQSRRAETAVYLSATGVVVGEHSTISDGRRMYAPVIRFDSQDGETVEFESRIYSRPRSFQIGDEITVIYDPKDPSKALTDNQMIRYIGSVIVGVIAFFLFLGGVGPLIYWYFAGRRERRLAKHGVWAEARVVDILQDENVKANKKHPWRIVVVWMSPTGKQERLTSGPIWSDPHDRVDLGSKVQVLIDPNKPDIHDIKLPGADQAATA